MMSTLSDIKILLEESELLRLKKNKVPLTKDERKEAKEAKAVWPTLHHGTNGPGSVAVWKSRDGMGNVLYVSNTQRAFIVSKTLKGIIAKFHKFIKRTA